MAYVGKVKGVTVNSVVSLLREEITPAAFSALEASLQPSTRALLQGVLAVAWIDMALWLPLLSAIHQQVCNGDDWAFKSFSRRVCARDFNLVYRVLLRFGSPASIIEKGAQVFAKYHLDAGTYVVRERFKRDGREYAITELDGFPPFAPERYVVAAFLEQLLHMSAGKNIEVKEIDFALGTTLRVRWESSWSA